MSIIYLISLHMENVNLDSIMIRVIWVNRDNHHILNRAYDTDNHHILNRAYDTDNHHILNRAYDTDNHRFKLRSHGHLNPDRSRSHVIQLQLNPDRI